MSSSYNTSSQSHGFTVGQRVSELSKTGKLYPGVIKELRKRSETDAYIKFDDDEEAWVDISSLTEEIPKCVQQSIDGITYQLEEEFDFSFISKYGKVFKVIDDLVSGAICFGVEKCGKRYFLKFVGAKTYNSTYPNIEDKITGMKLFAPKYKELKHPLLVNLIETEEIGGGFMMIFDWFDGEDCDWKRPDAQKRLLSLPNTEKQRIYKQVLDFHAHVIECGYIAIDFNKGALIYNFDNGNFAICDIDTYSKQYHLNNTI